MAKYIALPDTWFMGGTELHLEGEIYEDEESCNFDEFEVIDE